MIAVPEEVLTILADAFATEPAALTHLGGGREDSDGITYRFTRDGTHYVMKILAFSANDSDSLFRFEERLRFVNFLGQSGVPIVYPQPDPTGRLYVTQVSGDHLFVAYIYQMVQGQTVFRKRWSRGLIRAWGKTVGMVHRVTQTYPTWLHSVNTLGEPVMGWLDEWESFYDWCRHDQVQQRWLSIRERLENLPIERDGFGFVHNDPHAENILSTDTGVVLLDFDVANYHWFASDIAIAHQALLFRHTGGFDRPLKDPARVNHFLTLFLEGYSTENQLDPYWLGKLDLFLAYRRILLFTVMQDWLQSKPEVLDGWKKMIIDEPAIFKHS